MQTLTTSLLTTILLLLPAFARADEVTRQVQEELRRRHLFFNDIDGRNSPEVAAAVRRYQERQGFPATGMADETTLRSLGIIDDPAPPAEGNSDLLPDVPVLRSDAGLPPGNRDTRPIAPPPPAPTTHTPTRAEAVQFVRRYLTAAASPNIHDELGLYGERVDYYDHGMVDRQYVQNELAVYDQRWPRRDYKLANQIRVTENGGKTVAKFRVAFQVANATTNRIAAGRTDETFGLAPRNDGGLEIVSIREQRVRRSSHNGHAARPRSEDPVVRGVRNIFHGIFH